MSKKQSQAMGQIQILNKEIYEAGIKAQALLNDIQDATETILSGKDFNNIDFDKVIVLCDSCKEVQEIFRAKAARVKLLKEEFGL